MGLDTFISGSFQAFKFLKKETITGQSLEKMWGNTKAIEGDKKVISLIFSSTLLLFGGPEKKKINIS